MAPLANEIQEGSMHACMHMYKWQVKAMKAFGHVNEGQGPPPKDQSQGQGCPLLKKNAALSPLSLIFWKWQPLLSLTCGQVGALTLSLDQKGGHLISSIQESPTCTRRGQTCFPHRLGSHWSGQELIILFRPHSRPSLTQSPTPPYTPFGTSCTISIFHPFP